MSNISYYHRLPLARVIILGALLAGCAQATPQPAPPEVIETPAGAPADTVGPPAAVAAATAAIPPENVLVPAPTTAAPPTPPPPTATPVPQQQITITAPTPDAEVATRFTLSGQVALTPQDGRLVYLIRDGAGAIIGSGTFPVQGQPDGPGTFTAELEYLPSLPGPARVEVIAVDGSAAVQARIAPVVAQLPQGISLNLGGVARQADGRTAPRALPTRDWIDMSGTPEHLQVLFDGDAPPEAFSPRQRQVLVLPIEDYRGIFRGTDAALFDQTVQRLRDVLAARPATLDGELALLPASDQSQAFHAQTRYIDFAGGSGVRYLTYLTQEIEPFNSTKLTYVFQGLTNDGQNLVTAYFPISATLLAPDAGAVDKAERDRFKQDYVAYTAQTVAALEGGGYETTPSLAALDALMGSLQFSTPPVAQPTPAAAGALTGTATEQLKVRSGPGPRFRRLGGLEAREAVNLIGRNTDATWLQVQTDAGLTGWVSARYIEASGDVNALPVVE